MKWPVAGAALLIAGVAWWLIRPNAPVAGEPWQEPSATIDPSAHASAQIASASPSDFAQPSAAPIPPQPQPAWQTMAAAREHGDDRAPPIERPTPESQAPGATAWDLSDPARYREYELRGQRRLREDYLMAAEQELPKWKALLAQAIASGAPPAAINEARDKIRHLEARQIALRSEASRDAQQK